MELKTVTYQCPNCNAALEYNNAIGKFKCLFCDSEFTEEEIKQKFVKNENADLSQANLEAERAAAQDEANIEAEEFSGASALYTCPNCGAGVICDSLTASTRCHFCHTPVILTGRLSGEFKPDLIILCHHTGTGGAGVPGILQEEDTPAQGIPQRSADTEHHAALRPLLAQERSRERAA